MSKRQIIIVVLAALILAGLIWALHTKPLSWMGLQQETSQEIVDEDLIGGEVPLMSAVDHPLADVDTICVVDGKAYCVVKNIDMSFAQIRYGDSVLVEDPTLSLFSEKEHATKCWVSTTSDHLEVDFTKPESVARLLALTRQVEGFARYKKALESKYGKNVHYGLFVDYPSSSINNADSITRWLVDEIEASSCIMERVKVWDEYYARKPMTDRIDLYKGDVSDKDGLAQFLANRYFAGVIDMFGTDSQDYPACVYDVLSLRAQLYNDRFVTYQFFTDWYGGTQNQFTQQLISFDHVHCQPIDMSYLFKPEAFDAVLSMLEAVAKQDKSYRYWECDIWNDILIMGDEKPIGKLLPRIGLAEDGVVFSFQPYSLGDKAASAYNFYVPYSGLKPYLTDRGKWCLGL